MSIFTQICATAAHTRVKKATAQITCEPLSSSRRNSARQPLMRRHAQKLRSSVQHAQQAADFELQEEKGGFLFFSIFLSAQIKGVSNGGYTRHREQRRKTWLHVSHLPASRQSSSWVIEKMWLQSHVLAKAQVDLNIQLHT